MVEAGTTAGSGNSNPAAKIADKPAPGHAQFPPVSCLAKTCVFLVMVADLLLSGVMFGWSGLKQVLIAETQFASLCDDSASANLSTTATALLSAAMTTTVAAAGGTTAANSSDSLADETGMCAGQAEMFQLIFTVGSTVMVVVSLPVGLFLDCAGPMYTNLVACLFSVAGLVGLALADSVNSDLGWLFIASFVCLGIGGALILLASFPAAFIWPSAAAPILACIGCLIDASSVIWAIMAQLYFADPVTFSRANMFYAYAVVSLVMLLGLALSWFGVRRQERHAAAAADIRKQTALDDPPGAGPDADDAPPAPASVPLEQRSFGQQLKTFEFLVVVLFACPHITRCNFFISTVDELLYVFDAPDYLLYEQYTTIFSFMLPVGIVFIPVISVCVKKCGVVGGMHATNALGVVVGALGMVPSMQLQLGNFVVFAGFRAFLYAIQSVFIAETFGLATLGRISGMCAIFAAVANLLNYPAEYVTAEVAGGDTKPVAVFMLALAIVPTWITVAYHIRLRRRGSTKGLGEWGERRRAALQLATAGSRPRPMTTATSVVGSGGGDIMMVDLKIDGGGGSDGRAREFVVM